MDLLQGMSTAKRRIIQGGCPIMNDVLIVSTNSVVILTLIADQRPTVFDDRPYTDLIGSV